MAWSNAFVTANAKHIVGHILQAERRRRLVGSAITANIDRNNFEIGREVRDLIHPQVMVEGIRVNHDEGETFAGDFVVNFYAVGAAVHLRKLFKPFQPFYRFAAVQTVFADFDLRACFLCSSATGGAI